MRIRVEHQPLEENEVVLRCAELDEEMLEVLALLRERTAKLAAYKDGEVFLLTPGEVLYAEAVEGRTFLYTAANTYETQRSLAQLEVLHEDTGLIRISKAQLVNLYRVDSLKSLPNSRIRITLTNGEKLIASRHYIPALKARLGIEARGGEADEKAY